MIEEFLRFLNKYGQSFTASYGNTQVSGKAFIQPARYKNKQYTDDVLGKNGAEDMDNFVYIGDSSFALASHSNAIITACGKSFYIISSANVYFGNSPLYEWAVLRQYHGEGQ